MKQLLTVLIFFMCLCSFSQAQLKKTVKLPMFLSTLNLYDFKSDLVAIPNLNSDLKKYTFNIHRLEAMRRGGNFNINTKNINKNFAFLEIPSINLDKELSGIMLKIPGKDLIAGPNGFTL